jgi:hypothetical protein
MGDVVNLRTALKRAAQREKERRAAQNRIAHGRTKTVRVAEDARRDQARRLLDAHQIDAGDDK